MSGWLGCVVDDLVSIHYRFHGVLRGNILPYRYHKRRYYCRHHIAIVLAVDSVQLLLRNVTSVIQRAQ